MQPNLRLSAAAASIRCPWPADRPWFRLGSLLVSRRVSYTGVPSAGGDHLPPAQSPTLRLMESTTSENEPGWPTGSRHVQWLCFAAAIVGSVLIAVGLLNSRDGLVPPGAALVAVALTSYVASKSVITWKEQRVRDRTAAEYRHREEVYEEIVVYMTRRFIVEGNYDMSEDITLRSRAALWGSASTVAALQKWQMEISAILNTRQDRQPGVAVSLTPAQSRSLRSALGDAIVAMRGDLSPHSGAAAIDKNTLLESIFNEPAGGS